MRKQSYVLGYYADWETLAPERVDFSLFTHIAHAFARVDPSGAVTDLPRAKALCDGARRAGVETLLSVGGAGSNQLLTEVVADDAKRSRLLDGLMRQMEKYAYSGIDVDWEGLESAADQARMNTLVADLRSRLGKERRITMAVPATDWGGKWFDSKALLPLVDLINVMTYDFHGPWSERTGHNANLLPCPHDGGVSVEASVRYWLESKRWPRERLLVGIPCYGRGFPGKGWGEARDRTRKSRYEEISFNRVETLIRLGWRRYWDDKACVPYLVSPSGDELISYEDENSARRKGDWCRQQRVGGVFFWEISQDMQRGTNVIVGSARRGFLRADSAGRGAARR